MSESSPPSTSSATTNGHAVAAPPTNTSVTAIGSSVDQDRYRPNADTAKVHNEVIRSLASVVSTAAHTATEFVHLADLYDRDATTAIRYGHLVDASECMEIAMTHLGQLKAAMNHRLRLEDEQHAGETPY